MWMHSVLVSSFLVLAAPIVAQKAVGVAKPLTFEVALEQAGENYQSGHYGAAVAALQQAMAVAMKKRRAKIVAAMPAAPDGFTLRPQKDSPLPGGAVGALAGAMSIVGQQAEAVYEGPNGARISITVMADSAMGGLAAMAFNPMIIQNDPKSTLYEYEHGHKAVLKDEGSGRVSMNGLIGGKHMVQISARKVEKDLVLGLLNQACMDKLAAAIMK